MQLEGQQLPIRKFKSAFRIFVICVGVVSAVLFAVWHAAPHTTARVLITLNNASAGLTAKSISTEIGEINYLEGGQGPRVVLIHGIYARKEHWVDVARRLVDTHHVVILDLPGFGDNTRLPPAEYELSKQRDNLRIVFQSLGIERVHIGANSMGAYVATLLAAANPEFVASLAFIGSPLGVPTPLQSDMDKALGEGKTPLVVQTEADFVSRNIWLSPDIPYVPGPILQSWMQSEVATATHNKQVWDVVHNHSDVPTVVDLAPTLNIPSLILWCAPDRIFHVSGAALLEQVLPDSDRVILEDCGHVPMLDRPATVAEIYGSFLQTLDD